MSVFFVDLGDMCDFEELLVNAAIEGGLFFFLRTAVIANSGFHDEVLLDSFIFSSLKKTSKQNFVNLFLE